MGWQGFYARTAANLRSSDASIAERLLQNITALYANSQDLIKMAQVVVTLKIMPESPEAELKEIEEKAKILIMNFTGEEQIKAELEPIAFGLKALKLIFVMDESIGSTEDLENEIKEIKEVSSVEVADVRRAVG